MGDETPAPAVKAGFKTTEFWLSTLATVLGALMGSGIIADGSQAMRICGMVVVVLGALGYTVTRGVTKSAKILVIAILVPILLGACCRGHISAGEVAPLIEDVSARHDKLVQKAPEISEADKATYLRSTELLRKMVKEAQGK